MPLKFAANLSLMFKESGSIVERYCAAKNNGFSAVEAQFPYDTPPDALSNAIATTGLEQTLINSYPGDLSAGDIGFAAKPECIEEFKKSLDLTLKYAKAIKCKRIHLMSGEISNCSEEKKAEETYISNLKFAVEMFEKEGILTLIEPINNISRPHYFLSNFEQAVRYVKKINSKSLKIQLDIFHLQMICGNLTNSIKAVSPYIGYIQVSQAPLRDEPSALGEINYRYIFSLLEELGYDGWIGLEYTPSGSTEESLKWIKEYGYKL